MLRANNLQNFTARYELQSFVLNLKMNRESPFQKFLSMDHDGGPAQLCLLSLELIVSSTVGGGILHKSVIDLLILLFSRVLFILSLLIHSIVFINICIIQQVLGFPFLILNRVRNHYRLLSAIIISFVSTLIDQVVD